MELKARLASLEHQINSLQNALTNDENINYKNIQITEDFDTNSNKNKNLKTILMRLKMEHEAVLQNIEKALEIVDCPNQLKTPERARNSANYVSSAKYVSSANYVSSAKYVSSANSAHSANFGSPPSPRLRDKINNAILGGNSGFSGSPTGANNIRRTNSSTVITSSPLSPAVEKSHITFDILNELDNQNMPPTKQRKVHFESLGNGGGGGGELSVASREYLKKYGLL